MCSAAPCFKQIADVIFLLRRSMQNLNAHLLVQFDLDVATLCYEYSRMSSPNSAAFEKKSARALTMVANCFPNTSPHASLYWTVQGNGKRVLFIIVVDRISWVKDGGWCTCQCGSGVIEMGNIFPSYKITSLSSSTSSGFSASPNGTNCSNSLHCRFITPFSRYIIKLHLGNHTSPCELPTFNSCFVQIRNGSIEFQLSTGCQTSVIVWPLYTILIYISTSSIAIESVYRLLSARWWAGKLNCLLSSSCALSLSVLYVLFLL